MKISCVINVDSRPETEESNSMFNGVVNRDFLVGGLINKIDFFKGFDTEFIVFLDEHQNVDEETISIMRKYADVLIIRKHNKRFEDIENFPAFNDFNYLNALFCARGKYIFHFDGDEAAFTSSPEPIQEYIDLLEKYDFVSYPYFTSPYPVKDDSWNGKFWASTRFFCCKRSTLNFGELIKCQLDYDYWRTTYPMPKLCHWLEHILASMATNGVFYPPVDFDRIIIFTWQNYHTYTYQRLNSQTFEQVRDWVRTKHFHYPNNLKI